MDEGINKMREICRARKKDGKVMVGGIERGIGGGREE